MNVNKIIHEAMGLCWHEYSDPMTERPQIGRIECKACGDWSYTGGNFPDYTSPVHYCALMDWMREDGRNWKLRAWVKKDSGCCDMDDWMDLDTIGQVTLIAEAIEAGALKDLKP